MTGLLAQICRELSLLCQSGQTRTRVLCVCFPQQLSQTMTFTSRFRYLAAATLLFALVSPWVSCKKDDSGNECNLSNVNQTYNTNIKRIINKHCISCHSGSGPGGGDYTTYEGMVAELSNGKFRETVVIDKSMPQGGNMTQAERDSVNCWILSNFPK